MLLDKLITDVFDFFADNYNEKQKKEAGGFPDTSDKPIDHLITEQEKKDPEKLYPITSEVPVINFSSPKNLPLIDIIDGTFPSPIQTPFPENNTNYVRHYRLKNRDSGPTVIMINGLNVDEYTYFDWWCWRFAAWGLDSVLIDIPYHIRRVPKGSYSGQYLITDDVMWSLLSLKQCFQDIQLLANWLKNQGVESIGTFGVSFGAFMAGLYVCQAENADFAVMGMPPVDVVDTMSKIHLGQQLVEREARGEKTLISDPDIPNVFNMRNMTPNIDREKIFIAMGIYDRLVSPDLVRETAGKWGGLPWLMEYPTGHINTFVFNLRFVKDVRKFVRKEII